MMHVAHDALPSEPLDQQWAERHNQRHRNAGDPAKPVEMIHRRFSLLTGRFSTSCCQISSGGVALSEERS